MTLKAKPPRPKTCKNPACAEKFTPQRMGQAVCSPKCGLAIADQPSNQKKARIAIEQRERRDLKLRKEKVKSKAAYAKEAQAAINRYVRLRDAHLGCISCDKPASWQGQWHCSHFRSVGAAPHLRFNLLNMHKACSVCNNHLSGNIAGYRPKLIDKIGMDRVEWLESNHARGGHGIEYLKRLKAIFNKKANRLERRLAGGVSWTAM